MVINWVIIIGLLNELLNELLERERRVGIRKDIHIQQSGSDKKAETRP